MSGGRVAVWIALCALCACGGEPPGEQPAGRLIDAGGAPDARYELRVWASGPASPTASGGLRVRVELRPGWHLAPEARASLRFEESDGIRLEPSSQGGEDAVELGADALEFRARYTGPGEPRIRGQLKFGVCADGDTRCAIIRRQLDLRLALGAPR